LIREWPRACRRVVFVAPRVPEASGGAVVVHNLSVALTGHGVQVEHISLVPGAWPEQFPTHIVDAHPDMQRRPSFRGTSGLRRRSRGLVEVVLKRIERVRNHARLRRLLEGYGSDTVLVFTHVSAKIAADRSGWERGPHGPLIVGQHHSQFESIDLESWLRDAIIDHFQDLDLFMALTEEDAERFQEILRPPCRAMPNLVVPSVISPRHKQSLAVAISRLSHEKALDAMVRCFAAASARPGLEDWRLEIYGEGAEREVLTDAVRESGSQRIRLAGHSDDVNHVLADASVLLMTSRMEGLPMSILEAAVMGVPTIAFDCSPGVRALIGDDSGFLVPPGDEAAYTEVLAAALRSPDELARRGAAAKLRAEFYFPEHVLRAWGQALREGYSARARSSLQSL
jgi:glycosyltransferase involved in cell wall biosynthesis